jgi:hypothetical protein
MNNFNIYVKSNEWQPISGTPVFPFNYGQLLDERLNEAYITVMNSAVKSYRPTTEFRIDLVENAREAEENTTSQYYIVASDNAYEYPVGSGKYKHKLYLIERTKLLEGIMCQSVTFTNAKVNIGSFDFEEAVPFNIGGSVGTLYPRAFDDIGASPLPIDTYVSPVFSGESFNILSIKSVGEAIIEKVKPIWGDSYNYSIIEQYQHLVGLVPDGTVTSFMSYSVGGDAAVVTEDLEKSYIVKARNPINVQYQMTIRLSRALPGVTQIENQYLIYNFSYTFFTVSNGYAKKPWTVKDCVDRLLELAQPLYQGETPKYHLDPLQAAELDKIYAPEFTMTQCNLREQLKVIGGYIHAEPRLLGGDDEITLGDGTTVTRDRIIHFDSFDTDEVGSVDAPYVYNGVSHHINEYCTQIDTTASNIVNALDYAQGVVFAPNDKNFRTIRTDSVYVRVLESNGFIQTQFPIHEIVKVECCIYNLGDQGYSLYPVDITPYVFESTSYFANLSSFGGTFPLSKSYAIYYTIGERNIQGLFFKDPDPINEALKYYSIVNILANATGNTREVIRTMLGGDEGTYVGHLAFRVSYIPIYNTRFTHGKPLVDYDDIEYTRPYNQSENLIETRYYGENIKGVVARLGNVEQERTYIFNKEKYNLQRVPKIGQMLDGYAISAVNVSYNFDFVKCTLALSKDFNRISQFVGISSNKRVYEVSERAAYARNVLLKEYVTVGTDEPYEKGIFRSFKGLRSIFDDETDITPITAVCARGLTSITNINPSVMLPVVSSAFGNTMTFSWSYKDNYSAGDKVDYRESGTTKGYWQNDVPYCDYYGRMKYYDFHLLMTSELYGEFPKNEAMHLPQSSYIPGKIDGISTEYVYTDSSGNLDFTSFPYLIRKDSREVINVTFAVEFKSNMSSLIVGSAMASNCRLVSGNGKKPYLYKLDKKINKFQLKMTSLPNNAYDISIGENVTAGGKNMYIDLPAAAMDSTAWAICLPIESNTTQYENDDGEVYEATEQKGGDVILACNDPITFANQTQKNGDGTYRIYFNIARNIFN